MEMSQTSHKADENCVSPVLMFGLIYFKMPIRNLTTDQSETDNSLSK